MPHSITRPTHIEARAAAERSLAGCEQLGSALAGAHVFAKLGVRTRAELAAAAIKHGLG